MQAVKFALLSSMNEPSSNVPVTTDRSRKCKNPVYRQARFTGIAPRLGGFKNLFDGKFYSSKPCPVTAETATTGAPANGSDGLNPRFPCPPE